MTAYVRNGNVTLFHLPRIRII